CISQITAHFTDVFARAAPLKNVYDGQKAGQCLAALRALGDRVMCVPWFMSMEPSLRPCRETLDGTIAAGETCGAVEECRQSVALDSEGGGNVGCAELDNVPPKRCRAFLRTNKA